jgi:hypothetical protein
MLIRKHLFYHGRGRAIFSPRNPHAITGSMNMMKVCALVLALACLSAACDTSSDSTSSTPTGTPTPANTENFTGTVGVGATSFNPFTISLSNGTLTVTLTAAGPPPNIAMGIGVGTFSSGTCTPLTGGTTVAQASTSPQIAGTINAGSYCVFISDIGNATGPVSYAFTVTHF